MSRVGFWSPPIVLISKRYNKGRENYEQQKRTFRTPLLSLSGPETNIDIEQSGGICLCVLNKISVISNQQQLCVVGWTAIEHIL